MKPVDAPFFCAGSELTVKPIGVVRTEAGDGAVKESFDGVDGIIEVFDEYLEGLEDIEGFSHLLVICYLSKVTQEERKTLKVKPKWLIKFSSDPEAAKEVGVFSTRSPHRPNPIAVTVVRLKSRKGKNLAIQGLDLFNGTPVIDIKPYIPESIDEIRLPPWYEDMEKNVREKLGKSLF